MLLLLFRNLRSLSLEDARDEGRLVQPHEQFAPHIPASNFCPSADELYNYGVFIPEQFHGLLQPDKLIGLPPRHLLEVIGSAAPLETPP